MRRLETQTPVSKTGKSAKPELLGVREVGLDPVPMDLGEEEAKIPNSWI